MTTDRVADPDRQQVEVSVPGQPVRKISVDGILDDDAVPGFSVAVRDISRA